MNKIHYRTPLTESCGQRRDPESMVNGRETQWSMAHNPVVKGVRVAETSHGAAANNHLPLQDQPLFSHIRDSAHPPVPSRTLAIITAHSPRATFYRQSRCTWAERIPKASDAAAVWLPGTFWSKEQSFDHKHPNKG